LRVSNVPNEMPAYGMIPTYLVVHHVEAKARAIA
jgi:hypothetical protein